jgi:hypothetical protein
MVVCGRLEAEICGFIDLDEGSPFRDQGIDVWAFGGYSSGGSAG